MARTFVFSLNMSFKSVTDLFDLFVESSFVDMSSLFPTLPTMPFSDSGALQEYALDSIMLSMA